MPTIHKSGKKKTTVKKKPAKKGSKGGSKSGGGGDAVGPQDPIVISGGGSVKVKINGKFKDHGGGNWKNDEANLSSLSIDGGPPIPLNMYSEITIRLA